MNYDPGAIESKWQKRWLNEKIYEPDFKRPRGKGTFYNLMMFPYPSAEGLHVGNVYAFTGADIFGRFQRMRGYDVFEPIGLDGFGIHSENYALKIGRHPADQAKISEKNFYRQLGAIGNGFAWAERLETYDPEYYRWTQWIFVEMFRRGLAYRKKQAVNWCSSCKTVLADEQVISGECERCGTKVIKRELEQWFFKITKYAPRLLKNLETIDWSEHIKIAQKNWIGRSEGTLVRFKLILPGQPGTHAVEVFTTRADTLFGATFLAVSPELGRKWLGAGWKAPATVRTYIRKALSRRSRARATASKTGVFSGMYAINPANREKLPVWIADYVLGDVGTGAIMAVPAHDQRDYDFATKFKLPVKPVVEPVTGTPREREERRRSIVAVVENARGRVLSLNWSSALGGNLFIGGGIEPGEDPVACAVREIREETGYRNLALVARTETIHHHYIAHSKGVNRTIDAIGLRFRLTDDRRIAPKLEKRERFKLEWLTRRQAEVRVKDELHAYVFRRLVLGQVWTGAGIITGSGRFNGMASEDAKRAITKAVGGKRVTTYRLRDWLISRQRYWGPPIPIIYCRRCWETRNPKPETRNLREGIDYAIFDGEEFMIHPVPEKDLPVKLPHIKNFRPTGTEKSPLATVEKFWKVRCPKCRSWARRETDVSDTFLDSAWYYLRYPSTSSGQAPWDAAITKKWFPVDMYTGGAEHAVLHLLYVRFLAMAFYDWGLTHFEEPFKKFRAHGLLIKDGAKMSKSRGNVVNPDEYIRRYGADALRMYLMFLGPFEQGGDFRDTGIRGITRFLERVWRFTVGAKLKGQESKVRDEGMTRSVHQAAKKVTDDIAGLQYNTAISALMVLLNSFEERSGAVTREYLSMFLRLLAPFAPHIAEELWYAVLGEKRSIHRSPWPEADERAWREGRRTIVVQVNGRVRDRIEVALGATEDTVRASALARPKVQEWTSGKKVRRVIYVSGRIVNIVV